MALILGVINPPLALFGKFCCTDSYYMHCPKKGGLLFLLQIDFLERRTNLKRYCASRHDLLDGQNYSNLPDEGIAERQIGDWKTTMIPSHGPEPSVSGVWRLKVAPWAWANMVRTTKLNLMISSGLITWGFKLHIWTWRTALNWPEKNYILYCLQIFEYM